MDIERLLLDKRTSQVVIGVNGRVFKKSLQEFEIGLQKSIKKNLVYVFEDGREIIDHLLQKGSQLVLFAPFIDKTEHAALKIE